MSSGQTSAVAEMERYRKDQQILSATHNAFGRLPIDDKYLPIMNAYIKGHTAETIEKVLMSLLNDVVQGNSSAILEAINKNRQDLTAALREYDELTNR